MQVPRVIQPLSSGPWLSWGLQLPSCFGFLFGSCAVPGYTLKLSTYGTMTPATLKAWREVEPGRRKIMVGLGGAASTPPYQIWSQGNNVDVVARGLQLFFDEFKHANGFGLDGVDIDYEDSNALSNFIFVPPT